MAESVGSSVLRVRQALDSHGSLNLWEIQAILGESREYSLGVLSRLSSQPDIGLCREDERILVTLSRKQ
ncbi:MAG TPA: hypothetical protein VMM82_10230 [Spirochaetia bacterium]|nr:hypothetical protein [Spirochaetia bacterium]